MADWFRSWHGAPTDPKWLLISHRTSVPAATVSAIAWALMDYASQNEDRGSVAGFDAETYAVFGGISEDDVRAVIQAIADKGLIVDGRLTAWEKRQPKREDDSRDRVAALRARQRESERYGSPDDDVTHCNAEATQGNAPEAEEDADTEAELTATAAEDAPEVVPLMTNTERQVVDILRELPELSHAPIPDLLEHYRSFPSVKRLNADDQLYEAMGFRDLWRERFDADPKRRGKPWSGWRNAMNNFYRRSKPTIAANGRASPRRNRGPDYSGFDEFNRDMDALERRHAT